MKLLGDGRTTCPGCGAQLVAPLSVDENGNIWQAVCFATLRCDLCGGAKTRYGAKSARCDDCHKKYGAYFAWQGLWDDVGRQWSSDECLRRYDERTRPEREAGKLRAWVDLWLGIGAQHDRAWMKQRAEWLGVWRQLDLEWAKMLAEYKVHTRVLWTKIGVHYAGIVRTWRKDWPTEWERIGTGWRDHGKWSFRWTKMWGRMGAHARREHFRFVNKAAWDSEDPSIRRFSRIEID